MVKVCGVCNIQLAKYKCPSCLLQYCSIECYQTHQIAHAKGASLAPTQPLPNGLPSKPPPVAFAYPPPSPGSNGGRPLTGDILLSLQSSTDFQRLFSRYPHLRDQLREIYDATTQSPDENPDSHQYPNGKRSYRARGRGKNRGRGHDRGSGAPWSQQKGFRAGLHQMKRLRNATGVDGDGLREFSKLVTDLNAIKSTGGP